MWWGVANNNVSAVIVGGLFVMIGVGLQVLYLRYKYGRSRVEAEGKLLVAVPPGLLLKTFSSTLWDYSSSRVFTESHRVIVTVTVAEWEIVPLLAVIATV